MIATHDMTAAEFLEGFIPRWRAGLAPGYAPFVEGFLRRRRGILEVFVQRTLAQLRATRGELPDTVIEFAAYDPIVARERRQESRSDAAILRQLRTRVEERVARGREPERTTLAMFADDYVNARTEAILLRHAGWDAVPLMLGKPALAVAICGAVVAVRDTKGRLAIHPLQAGQLNHLRADFDKAEIRTAYLRDAVDLPHDTADETMRFAAALWASAREPAPPGVATPRPRTP